ncbi:MAG: response regulator [Oscillospiraceae bacterium]|nr:response regulator [Oscillospiraceae bacterium]
MTVENPEKGYEYTTLMSMLHVSVSKHLLDEHFTLVWANDFYYETIGYPKEEYESIYHNRPDLFYLNDQEEWNKIGTTVLKALSEGKKGYNILSRMRRKDGSYIWVRMAGSFTDEYIDGCQVSYTTMSDVSDIMRMQTEQTVTYNHLPGFVGKYRVGPDLSLTLLDANEQFIEFFGEDCWKNAEDSLFSRNIRRNAAVLEAWREKLLAGKPAQFMMQLQNRQGGSAWMKISATCIDWQGGCPVYLVVYIDVTDETELRQMQEALEKQAEELKSALEAAEYASRAKSDFLSHMSHDIRTPMNAIIGMTDIAQTHLQDVGKVEDCLKKISLSSRHLLGLINDVLDMSRIESGKLTINNDSISLPDILNNVVAIMQPGLKAKKQQFSIRLHGVRHEHLWSDRLRLQQIFINILSNASKFTPVEGRVSVCVEELEETGGDGVFRFRFTDNGKGMSPAFLQHLFEAFSREQDSRVDRTEGSGLGMAITKKLVDLLGGEIEVESAPGAGTTFTVTLPLMIEERPVEQLSLPPMRVIVVDDDVDACESMQESLEELGVYVDYAVTGAQGLEMIAAAAKRKEPYDAVFLDWRMPDMDGPETALNIRSQNGDKLPILIVSAYDWSDIEDEARRVGVDGFISKPLFASTLCRALQRHVLGLSPEEQGEEFEEKQPFQGRRLLLAEDNELNREVAAELLGSLGAQVEYACNGEEAVAKFKASPQRWYDVILMDVQMPVMDGYTATRHIRALKRQDAGEVLIVAMTADAFAEDVQLAKEAGMDGHMAKPLDLAHIRSKLSALLREREKEGAPAKVNGEL